MHQITLDEWINDVEIRYPIPRLPKKTLINEGWVDDWHYCAKEQPAESDLYYIIRLSHFGYMYGYAAWQGQWLIYDDWNKRWTECADKVLAWVIIPAYYRKYDNYLRGLMGLEDI